MGTPIQKLFTDRKNANGSTYVGEINRLWYDPATGFRVSDGITPGGLPATISTNAANIGDLAISGSTISTVNANENIVLQTNGTGEVSIIASFMVHTPAGQEILEIADDGTVTFISPTITSSDVAFEIIGNSNGHSLPPTNQGGMLEITGQPNLPNRIYIDAQNNYPVVVGRRYNGTTDSPTAVLSTQTFMRIGGNPYNGVGFTSTGTARIDFVTLEDQTQYAQGSAIAFYTTPIGTNQPQPGMIISNEGINHAANVTPLIDETFDLGASNLRWKNIWLGQGALNLADQTTNQNVVLTVNNGTFYINGIQNVVLGQIVISGSTIESAIPSGPITMGTVGDTGDFIT